MFTTDRCYLFSSYWFLTGPRTVSHNINKLVYIATFIWQLSITHHTHLSITQFYVIYMVCRVCIYTIIIFSKWSINWLKSTQHFDYLKYHFIWLYLLIVSHQKIVSEQFIIKCYHRWRIYIEKNLSNVFFSLEHLTLLTHELSKQKFLWSTENCSQFHLSCCELCRFFLAEKMSKLPQVLGLDKVLKFFDIIRFNGGIRNSLFKMYR